MNYRSSISLLNNFVRSAGVRPGLKRIKELLKQLGNPEKNIPVIHIAGTNGKGSVSVMTTNALLACDYRVGTYLSPHLIRYNERFLMHGEPIANNDFARLFSLVYQKAQKVEGITEFEILTAMAFVYFKENQVDVAVMETGLGGRYDATNVCRSILTMITPINFDHEEFFGNKLELIANEKAGIIKKGVPVAVAQQDEVAMNIIMDSAEKLENHVHVVAHPIKFKLALLGEYQRYNAALVITGLKMLEKYNIYIPRRLMLNGIGQTVIPGRTEKFSQKPVTILDVAHNPHGIRNLINVVRNNYQFKKKVFIIGMLKRKDLLSSLYAIRKFADLIVAVNIKAKDSYSSEEIVAIAKENGIDSVIAKENIEQAYKYAKTKVAKDKGVVLVAGSFYLIGEFYKKFK